MGTQNVGISYCRKSIFIKGMSDEQSVNYQQEAINRYAEQHGITIIKRYSDIGYSGKDAERPELQMVLEDLHSSGQQVKNLLFYSVDRLGRDLESNIGIMLNITKHVETVIFTSTQITSNIENFKIFFLLLTSQAQTERENLLLRMEDGRKAKLINRKSFNGSYLPLGYVKGKLNSRERLVPAVEENTDDYGAMQGLIALQYIFYQYVEGMSLRKLANNLQCFFGPTQRQANWTHKSVRYVLTNCAYIGKMQGTLKNIENYYIDDANIEPIIDPLLFHVVQRQLKQERAGREKSLASRLALYNLCLKCGNPLLREGRYITCRICKNKTEETQLLHVLAAHFKKVLERQKNEAFEERLAEWVKKQKWIRKKILLRLDKLQLHYDMIQNMSNYGEQAKQTMIRANTKKSTQLKRKLEWYDATIELFREKGAASQKEEHSRNRSHPLLFSRRMIRLSYLVMVDLDTKEIEVVFHEDLLKGGQ